MGDNNKSSFKDMQIKRFKKYPQIGEDAIVKYFNKEIVDFIKRPEFKR